MSEEKRVVQNIGARAFSVDGTEFHFTDVDEKATAFQAVKHTEGALVQHYSRRCADLEDELAQAARELHDAVMIIGYLYMEKMRLEGLAEGVGNDS